MMQACMQRFNIQTWRTQFERRTPARQFGQYFRVKAVSYVFVPGFQVNAIFFLLIPIQIPKVWQRPIPSTDPIPVHKNKANWEVAGYCLYCAANKSHGIVSVHRPVLTDTHTSIFVGIGGIFGYWCRCRNNSGLFKGSTSKEVNNISTTQSVIYPQATTTPCV